MHFTRVLPIGEPCGFMQGETNLERIIVFTLVGDGSRVVREVVVAFAVTCLLFMLCIYPVINAVLMSAVTDTAEQRAAFSRDVPMVFPSSEGEQEASSGPVSASQGRKRDALQ